MRSRRWWLLAFLGIASMPVSCSGSAATMTTTSADCRRSTAIECLQATYQALAHRQNKLVQLANDASDAFYAAETTDYPLEGGQAAYDARVSSAKERLQDAARRLADGNIDFVEALLALDWPSDIHEVREAWADAMRAEAAAMRRFAERSVDDVDLGLWSEAAVAAEVRAEASLPLRAAIGLPAIEQPSDATPSAPTTIR